MYTVSVIIPTYNRADSVRRSVESVLDQTLRDLELIVVDDASTDDTQSVIESYDDPRVTYLCHETNRGASVARNTGLDHATGDYVAFLDSDDVFRPEKLERQVETLESRNDDWVAAYCAVDVVYEDSPNLGWQLVTSLFSRRRETEGDEGGSELIADVLTDDLHTSAGSTLLVERDVAERIGGFDESFDRFQDPEFLIRVLQCGKLACVDEPLVERYASSDPSPEAVREADRHFLEQFSETVEELEARGYDVHGAHNYVLAKHFIDDGQVAEGLRYLRKSRGPKPVQYPGLIRSLFVGLRRRTN